MTTLRTLSDDSLAAVKRDHERLRYEVNQLRTVLRFFQSQVGGAAGRNIVATTTTIIPKRVGAVAGGPIMCQRKRLNTASPREFVDDGPPVPVYSWIKSDSTDPADEDGGVLWMFLEQDPSGTYWFTGQDCPAAT